MASPSSVITEGYGTPGSAALVITDGYGIAVLVTPPEQAQWPDPRNWPPVPGAPWAGRIPRARRNAGLEESPVVGVRPPFLFDENPKTLERLFRLGRQLAQFHNDLLRAGVFTTNFVGRDAALALSEALVTEALGYTPADAATPIPTTGGVIGGGTLGAPEVIRTDDTVVRQTTSGDGTNVILIRQGVPPATNPSGGVFLYVDQADGDMKTRDAAGAINVP